MRRRIALLLLLAVLLLAAACADDEDTEPTPTAAEIIPTVTASALTPTAVAQGSGTGFLAGRTRLSICVDGAAGLGVLDAEVERVSQALDTAAFNLDGYDWALEYLHEAAVVAGCPPPTVPFGTRIRFRSETYDYINPVIVPSEHLVFMYFLPEAVYTATFGNEPYFTAPAELCCEGHNRASVTTGVYVTPTVSESTLGEALVRALGLYDPCEGRDPCT